MSLLVSKVPRSLETKTKLFGFELGDLLLIFLYLSVSNLIFGTTVLRPYAVWLGTLALAGALYFIKRGQPDGYLQHLGEYIARPAYFAAGSADRLYRKFKKRKIHVRNIYQL